MAASSSYKMTDLLNDPEAPMVFEANRMKSFGKSWPFTSKCSCTPQKLAEAGFFHVPSRGSPDNVKCFVCFKELEGWEPEDDPWKEHARSKDCQFVMLGKKEKECSVGDMLDMLKFRRVNLAGKEADKKIEEFIDEAEKVRNKLLAPLKNTPYHPAKNQ